MPINSLSLREKKQATLKLKILDTFDEKLKTKALADISVKEVAKELDISEMTFFNYFGSKKEVLIYFIELWSLEMQMHIEGLEPLEAIYRIFEDTAIMIEKNPNLFMEIVASMALQGMAKKNISVGKAERILHFGKDVPYEVGGFFDIIVPLLSQIESSQDKLALVYLSLFNTCFAMPLAMRDPRFGSLKERYFEQLDFILKSYK
ncbi:MAG: TetR/AcrR family transcriptional regulator [Epsilonproteobacteria bacterium]|nr:TetR/AcrR family transcriptional regulator [Campylobacterota bacterium]